MVCGRAVREAHVPPTAPKCPSCGAKTVPNAAMRAQAGNVICRHCGYVEPAYENALCPKCDTIYVAFVTRKAGE